MKYPTHLQYIETLNSPEALSKTLGTLRLCLNHRSEPIFSSGNFGTVFKVTVDGLPKALKCFTRDQSSRANAYRIIAGALKPSPPYIIPYKFLDNELTVFDNAVSNTFPVLLMEWIEGETMTTSLRRASVNQNAEALDALATRFDALSHWLLSESMAHGDLKPDNIMVGPEGALTLIDYDGMYLPQMKGSPQRELGTVEFQHPLRHTMAFDKPIDHYSMALISLTIHALQLNIPQLTAYFVKNGFLFTPSLAIQNNDPNLNLVKNLIPTELQPLIAAVTSQMPVIANIQEIIPLPQPALTITDENTLQKLIPYKENGKYGFVNQFNAIKIAAQFDSVEEFSESRAAVCKDNLWGYIDPQGIVVVPFQYHYAAPFCEQVAAVSIDKRFGYINSMGEALTPIEFNNAWSFHNGRGLVKDEGKYGFVDLSGAMVISAKFDYARSFNENIACVQENNLYGYIDLAGNWLVPPQYKYAGSVHNGVAEVEINGSTTFIELES